MKTRGDIRTAVRVLLNERTPSLYSDDDINSWINDGQRDIASKARCIESTQDISMVASTREYSFTGFQTFSAVYSHRSLEKISIKQIGHIKENGTVPQFFYEWNNKVGIIPVPSTTGTVTLYTAIDSTDMTADDDTSTLPLSYQGLIELYATYRGLIRVGKLGQALQVYQMYIRELQFNRDEFARIPDDVNEDKIPDVYAQRQQR